MALYKLQRSINKIIPLAHLVKVPVFPEEYVLIRFRISIASDATQFLVPQLIRVLENGQSSE